MVDVSRDFVPLTGFERQRAAMVVDRMRQFRGSLAPRLLVLLPARHERRNGLLGRAEQAA